jgi:DNA-directed RNA polymerase subunit alpha
MPRIPYKDLMQSDEMTEKLEMSTAEIGLSVRTTNCLEERGIFTVHDLLNCTRADLLSISNFGEKTLEEVYKALEKIGFFRSHAAADAPPRQPIANGTPISAS